ncbi:hypothetical protein GM708_01190 [Vibrio cholerae]|nr:hypothetical protein [Vibrio cholerae]
MTASALVHDTWYARQVRDRLVRLLDAGHRCMVSAQDALLVRLLRFVTWPR